MRLKHETRHFNNADKEICGIEMPKQADSLFSTVVTYGRKGIFRNVENVVLLRQVFRHVIDRHPFVVGAFVFLPEYLHCIRTIGQE